MTAILAYPAVFTFGGLAYGLIELAYRGRTHWTMLLVGGLCVLLLYIIAAKSDAPVWRKWITGCVVITTVEFVSGILINIIFSLNVWDYSPRPLDLFGQVCLLYTLFWFLLTVPAVWLLRLADARIFRKWGAAYDTADSH